jgi:hypothetical protein
MAVSFSTLAQDADKSRDNVHYNIHQRGDQNTSQYGSGNQSSQVYGSGHQSSQDSTWSQANEQNRQRGSASAGASADEDRDQRENRSRQHTNKGWHKGWDNPENSGSTRY